MCAWALLEFTFGFHSINSSFFFFHLGTFLCFFNLFSSFPANFCSLIYKNLYISFFLHVLSFTFCISDSFSDSFFCLFVFQSFYLSSSPFFLLVCLSQILGWLCKNKQAYFTFHPTDERLPWLKMQTKIWKKI